MIWLSIFFPLVTRISCESGYKLPYCNETECTPKDDKTGHYKCDGNGNKVCRIGWKNETANCLIKGHLNMEIFFLYTFRSLIKDCFYILTKIRIGVDKGTGKIWGRGWYSTA